MRSPRRRRWEADAMPKADATKLTYRRSREGGNPWLHRDMALKSLDPRVRGDDDLGEPRREPSVVVTHLTSFPRRREPRASSRHGA
ncbi:hypothetical protein GLE_3024 [Lysobacter enzymogenes]|uniref:Uncharacterized protein n=1 Tax=Lysobacter enzymogenes TaxID=69 RepID=A0A0S2DIN9_LYSEN|nr:hypothetical protein GLE_3024 [Lysobacter enzymogenes]